MTVTIARDIASLCYPEGWEYVRPINSYLWERGGIRLSSSNDGEGTFSFSPTDVWEFPDGSKLEVGYSVAEVLR